MKIFLLALLLSPVAFADEEPQPTIAPKLNLPAICAISISNPTPSQAAKLAKLRAAAHCETEE